MKSLVTSRLRTGKPLFFFYSVGWKFHVRTNPILYCTPHTRDKAGSLKINTALEYRTRVVQEGGRQCKKSTLSLNDLVHLTPLRIPLMNPPIC
jgi:hypothetical protein